MQSSAKNELKFPVLWHGRLITVTNAGDFSTLVNSIFMKLNMKNTAVLPGNLSANATYKTWQLQAELPDRDTMTALFNSLKNLPGVKMLI